MGRRTHQCTARASGAGARLRRERRGSVAIEACAPVAFVLRQESHERRRCVVVTDFRYQTWCVERTHVRRSWLIMPSAGSVKRVESLRAPA